MARLKWSLWTELVGRREKRPQTPHAEIRERKRTRIYINLSIALVCQSTEFILVNLVVFFILIIYQEKSFLRGVDKRQSSPLGKDATCIQNLGLFYKFLFWRPNKRPLHLRC